YPPSRPLSVAIPRNGLGAQGPYCPRRPNLSEILANTAAPPWTLSAFMAYLSQNHCLETLEFTMDASRYRKHYNKMISRSSPDGDEATYIKGLWQRLMEAYIVPNGAREVNIPGDVRSTLLSFSDNAEPPHPSMLDPAVGKIYELMEDSVLVPFLNSFYVPGTDSGHSSEENLAHSQSYTQSYDDRQHYRRTRDRQRRSSPGPPLSMSQTYSPSSPLSRNNRASAPSSIS
ncbi:regulator of G protein signaling superfamily, partial [Aulographum hederae CBS 113979]